MIFETPPKGHIAIPEIRVLELCYLRVSCLNIPMGFGHSLCVQFSFKSIEC